MVLSIQAVNPAEITLAAPLGPTYRIEATDLLRPGGLWKTVTNLTQTIGPETFVPPATSTRRHFRAVLD